MASKAKGRERGPSSWAPACAGVTVCLRGVTALYSAAIAVWLNPPST
jgi:hypothetical protein